MRIRAILFDMDNTLLASRIDYDAMRREVGEWLVREGFLAEGEAAGGTTASLINAAAERGLDGSELDRVWAICARHETEGMRGAGLEPGARETLERLRGRGLLLVILTNNALAAAERALDETGIRRYFDCVAGRESVPQMKPSPDAVRAVLARSTFCFTTWVTLRLWNSFVRLSVRCLSTRFCRMTSTTTWNPTWRTKFGLT